MNSLLIEGMQGLGDNIYQYPIIQHLSKSHTVYLKTPWPQIYKDLHNVRFVKMESHLRTQSKNLKASTDVPFVNAPNGIRVMRLSYTAYQKMGKVPLFFGLMQSVRLSPPYRYHLALRPSLAKSQRKPHVLIKPPTIRKEWMAPSRNSKMEYFQACIGFIKHLRPDLEVVVIADVAPPDEKYDGRRPLHADTYYEKGELGVEALMDLFYTAELAIGSVGFFAPMGIALGTPTLLIHGGAGGWNHPDLINAPGEGKLDHLLPEKYCLCRNHRHECDKKIDLCKLKQKLEQHLLVKSQPSQIGNGMVV